MAIYACGRARRPSRSGSTRRAAGALLATKVAADVDTRILTRCLQFSTTDRDNTMCKKETVLPQVRKWQWAVTKFRRGLA